MDVVRAGLKDAAARPEPGDGDAAPPLPGGHQHDHQHTQTGGDQTNLPGRNQTGSPAEFSLREEFNLELGSFTQLYHNYSISHFYVFQEL